MIVERKAKELQSKSSYVPSFYDSFYSSRGQKQRDEALAAERKAKELHKTFSSNVSKEQEFYSSRGQELRNNDLQASMYIIYNHHPPGSYITRKQIERIPQELFECYFYA